MQIALVSVIRNEADIMPAFLPHAAALFDRALLLDHGSTDGTGPLLQAACAARPGWARWRVDVPGHHQALFSAFAMRHLFETTDADMVVFLDADEFLDVPSREALVEALAGIEGERTAGRFDWVDCIPEDTDSGCLRLGDPIWSRMGETPFPKVVVPRRFYAATGGALAPSSGNHTALPNDGGPVSYHPLGRMLHVPLRSVTQLRQKIVSGALSVLARTDNANHENSHWFDALPRLAEACITPSDLIHLAKRYGHKPAGWAPIGMTDLPALGFTRRLLDVAHAPLDLPAPPPPVDGWRILAAIVRDWRAEHAKDIGLVLEGDVLTRALPKPQPAPAPALAEASAAAPWQATLARLEEDLAAARAAAAQARAEVAILRASTSYRVTAPLRAAMRALRRQPGP